MSSGFYLQCNIDLQDCNSLHPRPTSQQVAFTNTSCVRDTRIPGNVGRCGWAGASCQVNGTVSNCAWPYADVCHDGVCIGGVGQQCIPNGPNYMCNDPVHCNVTVSLGPRAICGGEGAAVNLDDASKGLDFGRDYCVSSVAAQNSSNFWTCTAGDDPIPSPLSTASPNNSLQPTSNLTVRKKNLSGPIAGAAIGGLLLCLFLAFCWYRRRMRRQNLLRVDAWKGAEDSSQDPPLLHRRGLSEQSNVTTHTTHSATTSQSHVSPYSAEPSPEMRVTGSRKLPPLGQSFNIAAAFPPTETTDNSDALTQESLVTPHTRKGSSDHGPTFLTAPSTFVSSTLSLPQESPLILPAVVPAAITPTVSFLTSPVRSRFKMKPRNASSSSLPRSRLNSPSTIPTPDSPPVSTEDVEQRLMELRNEAERGLAEIRAQRTGSAGDGPGEMPPPYRHLP